MANWGSLVRILLGFLGHFGGHKKYLQVIYHLVQHYLRTIGHQVTF